jgi:hypothetical protein
MMKLFVWLLLVFTLCSCSSKPALAPRPSNLIVDGVAHPVELSAALNKIDGEEIWYSSFSAVPPTQAKDLILRRKTLFLSLFVDDTDPYTRITNAKSKCLKREEETKVHFSSGAPPEWNSCSSAKKEKIMIRQWIECGSTVWEFTHSQQSDSLEMDCN